MTKGKPRISDIARQSGVSISTVSLVLNNKPGISEETRARVLEAAEKLEYPLKLSSDDKNISMSTIGMLIKTDPDSSPQANPFYSKVILGIEDVCRRNGINLLFATLPVDENNIPIEIPQLLYNDTVDGLLMVGICANESFKSISDKRMLPVVLVDGYSKINGFDSVVSDNFQAAYQAVEYLIRKGHRHIGLAGGGSDCFPSLRERRNGYLRALKENKIGNSYITNFNINQSHGYQEILSFLKEYPHLSALFCVNDDVGSDAIRAVQDLGKRVPQDISVISYDDTFIASLARPTLTTMHVDTLAMGRAAVHLLSLRIENPDIARMTLTVHSTLVERESAAFAPSSALKKGTSAL